MQWSTFFFGLAGIAFLLTAWAKVWELLVAGRLSLLLTIGSFFFCVFGLVLLIRHWDELKRAWATSLLALSCAMVAAGAGALWYLVEVGQRYDSAALHEAPSSADP